MSAARRSQAVEGELIPTSELDQRCLGGIVGVHRSIHRLEVADLCGVWTAAAEGLSVAAGVADVRVGQESGTVALWSLRGVSRHGGAAAFSKGSRSGDHRVNKNPTPSRNVAPSSSPTNTFPAAGNRLMFSACANHRVSTTQKFTMLNPTSQWPIIRVTS